jgi:hypothetical protein
MWSDAAAKVVTGLRPVPPGLAYRVNSGPGNAPVTEELAAELSRVLERFARELGFTELRPVKIEFDKGTLGHHRVGRATDIYGVEGIGLDKWKANWDARRAGHSNLGWRLYKALQAHGRWAQPYGYPIQLFGPWTREEGPWKFISDRLLAAHRDHIHVAK